MPYNDLIVNLAENPEHIGSMDENDADVGMGEDGAPECGDFLRVYIKVNKQNIIEDVLFKIFGCGSAIASSEFMAQMLIGKSIDSIVSSTENDLSIPKDIHPSTAKKYLKTHSEELNLENLNQTIAKELKLPPIKFHCSVLAKDAITKAIENLKSKRNSSNTNNMEEARK